MEGEGGRGGRGEGGKGRRRGQEGEGVEPPVVKGEQIMTGLGGHILSPPPTPLLPPSPTLPHAPPSSYCSPFPFGRLFLSIAHEDK